MGRRLALVADDSHETPWMRATGSESGVHVGGLGVDDAVGMTVDLGSGEDLIFSLTEGQTSLLTFPVLSWKRYKVWKKAGTQRVSTVVEVFLG